MKKSWILALLLAAGLAARSAHANFVFTIERLSDTQALITGSGSASDLASGGSIFIPLDGVLTGPPGGITIGSPNTLLVGDENVDSVLLSSLGQDIQFEFSASMTTDGRIYDGDAASGSVLLTVGGTNKWVDVGNTGTNGRRDQWSMVAPQGVPEPGTLALLGLGLAGVAATRRRKSG